MALLSSELVKITNLQLASKLVSEELMLGIHASKRYGYGIEFEQYRHYEIGDDPKRIDWKLFARTQKHLVRESSTESNYHIRFVLDLSGSMNYVEEGVSRLQYCKILLASIAYMGFRQGDQLSLYVLKDNQVHTLVASGKQAFQRILYALEKAEASGKWTSDTKSFPVFQQKQKEILFFASDLLQLDNEWIQLLKKLANPRREIYVFQVLGQHELDFDLKGFYRFKDLETGQEVELQAEQIKDEVKANAESFLSQIESDLKVPFVYWKKISLKDPIAGIIREIL
ncbi:DUF58 domain-containing protein [Flectobacillus rivi]|uniref:DUF58 domain-containing protein n=1 Tax=Flectobacillus rivi TaxID=2984209 RepID=A0ABT6YY94_9BACT|nr:DUF58 domain-containing protein [Flectobacillus rivi]MDI9873326.1 DUF58 domain-containing protein [Flectobacillus rivi]